MGALLALTLFGSVVYFWLLILLFLIICIISDIKENGFIAFISFITLYIVCYYGSDVKTILDVITVYSILVYLCIGLGFSVFRTFFAGRKLGKKLKDLPNKEDGMYVSYTKESVKSDFINEMKGNVFRWWFMWPISLLTWIATDFIVDVWDYAYNKVSKFYNYVLELGIKSIGL